MAMRFDFADYYKGGTITDFMLMGTGFTTLDENPSAQTQEKIYVNQKSSSNTVSSYQTQFPFEADMIESEEIIVDMYDIATRHATGAAAEREYVRVELWRPVDDETPNIFKARKFKVSVQVDSIAGPGGEMVVQSGNLNGLGDPEIGSFDTTTKVFTKD